jgi:hypothetical protein
MYAAQFHRFCYALQGNAGLVLQECVQASTLPISNIGIPAYFDFSRRALPASFVSFPGIPDTHFKFQWCTLAARSLTSIFYIYIQY